MPMKDHTIINSGQELLYVEVQSLIFLLHTYIISIIILGILTAWIFMMAVYRNTLLSILKVFFLINLFLVSNASHAAVLFNFPSFEKASTIISIGFFMIIAVKTL